MTQNNKPVENLEGQLKVIVTRTDVEKSLELGFTKKYNDPGRYAAHFLPTKAGTYVFRITGEINKIKIDEVFASGKQFHDVADVESLKVP